MSGGNIPWGNIPGWNFPGGILRGGNCLEPNLLRTGTKGPILLRTGTKGPILMRTGTDSLFNLFVQFMKLFSVDSFVTRNSCYIVISSMIIEDVLFYAGFDASFSTPTTSLIEFSSYQISSDYLFLIYFFIEQPQIIFFK